LLLVTSLSLITVIAYQHVTVSESTDAGFFYVFYSRAGFEVLFEVFPIFLYRKVIRCTKSLGNIELKILMKVDVIYKNLYATVKISHRHQYYEENTVIIGFCHVQHS